MEVESPSHYNRYVLNSWEDLDIEDKVIPYSAILDAVNRFMRPLRTKRLVSCDPAEFGNDETVIYGLESGKIIKRDIFLAFLPINPDDGTGIPIDLSTRIIDLSAFPVSHSFVVIFNII